MKLNSPPTPSPPGTWQLSLACSDSVAAFITRWEGVTASELATSPSFMAINQLVLRISLISRPM
jgi:hypothetical protein